MNIQDMVIYKKTIPARPGHYAEFPEQLSAELKEYLKAQGITRLYTHQAEMFEKAEAGSNIVITTSTASGKTLSFLLPVLQQILSNPLTRAVFIYPTKALASDQYRALQPYLKQFGAGRIQAGVYDGDTTPKERSRIRKSANIILTNPEMINGAFLPNHSRYGFDFIFSNLSYVVIDELHTYRGVFGSHMANLFRRLGRVCRYYHSRPQFLCSSATIANPLELAEEICGTEFIQIAEDGSPASKRTYYLVQPPRLEDEKQKFQGQLQATGIAAELLPWLVEEGHNFIAFAKSRRNVEVVLREARDKLEQTDFLGQIGAAKTRGRQQERGSAVETAADRIAGYRGGYTPMERKAIEHRMITGELQGLVSTNALELGIDIGKVDTAVLVGYPGTRASFWQQTGRAGRGRSESCNYLILESGPFDQYIGVNPDWLFDAGSESAVVDKNNLLIELAHIRAAAAELPLTLDDISLFPDLGEAIPVLLRVKELENHRGKFAWNGSSFPAGDFSMRNIDQKRYKLMNKETHREITEMDEMQAFREIHDGAIYMHDGSQYMITELDLETRTAYAVPYEGNYYTMPAGVTEVSIIKAQEEKDYGRSHVVWGDVNVSDQIYMYKKLQFHNHQNLGYEQLKHPLNKEYDTEAMWLSVPENVVRVYRSLLQPTPDGNQVRNNHFDGLCHAVKTAARMTTMTEQEDIGVSMSVNAIGMNGTVDGDVVLFLYDKFTGGLGYAEKAYERMETIVDHAVRMVGACTCKDGCAACVGDYKLDKRMVLWGLRSLQEELAVPEGMKYVEYAERPAVKKAFRLEELPERWGEFCSYIEQTGDSFAAFLHTVPFVEVKESLVTLYIKNDFYRDWILEEHNRKSLENIFMYYTQTKGRVHLRAESGDKMKPVSGAGAQQEKEAARDLKDKLQRRYRSLTEKQGEGQKGEKSVCRRTDS